MKGKKQLQVADVCVARQRLGRRVDGVYEVKADVRQFAQCGAGQQLKLPGAILSIDGHYR